MNTLKEIMLKKLIEAMYGVWCDLDNESACQAAQDSIDNICAHYASDENGEKYINAQITQAICEHEKAAFMDGFRMCLQLLQGEDLTK